MSLNDSARDEWPTYVEIDGEEYEEEALGAYKKVYRSQDGEKVAVFSSMGGSLEEQATHAAAIMYNEEAQREYGIETATDYQPVKADVNGDVHPALVGDFRDDLLLNGDLDEILEDKEMQERAYNEIFVPVRELAEQGGTSASPRDFVRVDSKDGSNLIYDSRNFGYDPEKDTFEIVDNGELKPIGFTSGGNVPEAELSAYSFAEAEDFAFERKHFSPVEFIQDNKIDRRAQEMLDEILSRQIISGD